MEEQLSSDWQEIPYSAEEGEILPNSYRVYLLSFESFNEHLNEGLVELPNADGSFSNYKVEPSAVMSPALQEKFPNIRSYQGFNTENKLCQCRIERKEDVMSFAIYCNDASYFIADLQKSKHYFFYNKKDLPEGYGNVNE